MIFPRCARRTFSLLTCALALTALAIPVNAEELPSADSIVAKSIDALGGRKAIDAIQTVHVKISIQAGMVMTIDSNWARSGERFMRQGVGGMSIPIGFDGETAWSQNPMSGEYQIIEKDQVYRMDRQANMHMRFLLLDEVRKNDLEKLETIEAVTFGEHECYKLHFVPKDGQGAGYLYFDRATSLPVGMETANPRNPANAASMIMSDWREIDGVKFFFKMTGSGGGQALNFVVDELTVNDVDRAIFELPEGAKALAGKATSRPDGGPKLSDFNAAEQEEIKEMLSGLKGMSPDQISKQVSTLESALPFMPEDKRGPLQYVVNEAKKLLAAAGAK